MEKNYLSVTYCKERAMGRLLQQLGCCCFNRGAKIILREFLHRNDLESEFYNNADNNVHTYLYIVFNSK